jgi:hypothetical protein
MAQLTGRITMTESHARYGMPDIDRAFATFKISPSHIDMLSWSRVSTK